MTLFGFLPLELTFSHKGIEVGTLPGLKETIDALFTNSQVEKSWVYAPRRRVRQFGDQSGIREMPLAARVFVLKKTHWLKCFGSETSEHAEFLVWVFSFFIGMRLTTSEGGFVDATPIKPFTMGDFYVAEEDFPLVFEVADTFWTRNVHDLKRAKLLCAIIHALFQSALPQALEFEQFSYASQALEASYKLTTLCRNSHNKAGHGYRTTWMCDELGITKPNWPLADDGKITEVVDLRNSLVHEALFLNEPLGFKLMENHNLLMEIRSVVSRALVSILDVGDDSYIKSPINTRSKSYLRMSM